MTHEEFDALLTEIDLGLDAALQAAVQYAPNHAALLRHTVSLGNKKESR